MTAFIEVVDNNGNPGFIKAEAIEATGCEPGTGITRVFVSSSGFYRVQDTQQEIIARIGDIETIRELEGRS